MHIHCIHCMLLCVSLCVCVCLNKSDSGTGRRKQMLFSVLYSLFVYIRKEIENFVNQCVCVCVCVCVCAGQTWTDGASAAVGWSAQGKMKQRRTCSYKQAMHAAI